MKQTSNRSDATDLGPAERVGEGDLPIELKPGVMGLVVVRLLKGQSPLGRRRGARFFADNDLQAGGLVAGFGEEEQEDFEEDEDEDFEEEDEFGEEEDEDFDEEDDEDAEEDEFEDDDEQEDDELDEEEEEEEFDDED